ncbi:MAG: dihydroflavonol 4-reductase, partial [Peptostreptococcaceae bacterium]|nr:dihydroflavonol 4-reductase [Peptostreptococcaceae bacterium]
DLIFPSGIIGPYDLNRNNHLTHLLERMAKDPVFLSVRGGYDFVDVRDVAEAILLCEKHGKKGESYIISGGYYEIGELHRIVSEVTGTKKKIVHFPIRTAELIAPLAETVAGWLGKKPLLTPYSIYTLRSNSNYSCEKAMRELNYRPRPIAETIRAMLEKK